MTEPASHTLAYLRRLDEKFDRLHSDVGEMRTEVVGRLDRVEGRRAARAQRHRAPSGRARGRDHGLKAILDRHERALALLGRRLAELEGAPKG